MPRFLAVALTALMSVLAVHGADTPDWISSPRQPADGPGGSEYAYDCFRQTSYGAGASAYQIFEPACPRAATNPSLARPVTVFLHGFGVTNPALYIGWIRHVVRRGSVVVFPIFQSGPFDFYPTDNAAFAINAALAELQQPGYGAIDVSNLTIVGHSVGGGLALNMGALAGEGRVPVPANIVAVEPQFNLDAEAPGQPDRFGFVRDWEVTPPTSRVVIVVGGQDDIVGDESAFVAWPHLDHLPVANRSYVQLRSDYHGSIAMVANHFAPLSPDGVWIPGLFEINGHDFLMWAIADSLIACPPGWPGDLCPPAPSSIGSWSDGTPMQSAAIINEGTPARIGVTIGNSNSYLFFPVFERLAPLCPYLGALCGTPPRPAGDRTIGSHGALRSPTRLRPTAQNWGI